MATQKIDRLCADFLKRVPDQFRSPFTPGLGQTMPDGHLLKAEVILDYINKAMMELFNDMWQSAGAKVEKFISIFPELVKMSNPVPFENGNYTIASPYKDFYKLIGAIVDGTNKFIKVKPEYLYTVYLSGEYGDILKPTADDPVIIQIHDMLSIFPQDLSSQIKFQYIKVPLNSSTGALLEQNGSEDSPYFEHWHEAIVSRAYLKYLQVTNETT